MKKYRVSGICDEVPFQVDIKAENENEAKLKVKEKYDATVLGATRICNRSKCSGEVIHIEKQGYVCQDCGWTSIF